MIDLGKRIQGLRKENKLSQVELASVFFNLKVYQSFNPKVYQFN